MSKQYQTADVQASMSSVLGLAVPEQVSVALAEIAESAKEGLLALAVGAGLQVVGTLMESRSRRWPAPRASTTPSAPPCGMATSRAR
jgi:putative transposase